MKRIAFVVLVASTSAASADPPVATSEEPPRHVPSEPPPVPQPAEPVAKDAAGAPVPTKESGRIDAEQGDSTERVIARAALFPLRMLLEFAVLPVRGAMYVEDRYGASTWYYKHFYNEDRTIGILPTATFSTGYGLTVGAQAFDLDTFGRNEKLVLEATTGFEYRVGFLASLDSGDRFGRLRIGVSGNFDRRPSEPFYGIGNSGDLHSDDRTGQNINAQTNSFAETTYFRYQEARAVAFADVTPVHDLHFVATGWLSELKYTPSNTEPSVQDVYMPSSLVGFDTTTKYVYGEASLRWDTRRSLRPWEPLSVNSYGSLVAGFGGYVHQFDEGSDFWHYGAELQHYFRLGDGPRVIMGRFHGEAVGGELDEVPITELPMLGGSTFLRGYPYARFRDRIAAVGSVQYMWPLLAHASGILFTDVGRVWENWNDLTLADLHWGFGTGVEVYGSDFFVLDFAIATSSDGGVAFSLEFSPVLNARTRWR